MSLLTVLLLPNFIAEVMTRGMKGKSGTYVSIEWGGPVSSWGIDHTKNRDDCSSSNPHRATCHRRECSVLIVHRGGGSNTS